MTGAAVPSSSWSDPALAAALMAVDPAGIGGVLVRSPPGPPREEWLAHLRGVLPQSVPFRRLPVNVPDQRLLGGLDLAATLQAGRLVAERGVLAEANGGIIIVAMAERLSQANAARIAAVLDTREVIVERDAIAARQPSRLGVIALHEGVEDERPPAALCDRLAIHIDLGSVRSIFGSSPPPSKDAIALARARLFTVRAHDEVVTAICEASLTLGIASSRAPFLALQVARASAALCCREAIEREDLEIAARLVLAPRATQLPADDEPEATDADFDGDAELPRGDGEPDPNPSNSDKSLGDLVLKAASAHLPADVLASLKLSGGVRSRKPPSGRTGIVRRSQRGRPVGSRRGDLRGGARLHLIDTIVAAVPWQPLRRRERAAFMTAGHVPRLIEVRREDFHVTHFRQRTQTTTVFVVDASGSAALNRLAEAKGAVEHLLADCYVRRDQVALIAFRRAGAELLLPPTRSLVRAKRSLAGLPGGGGTPLASGIDAARDLAQALRARGQTPAIVFLTDGQANIARDGTAGRAKAEHDALASARLIRLDAISALLIDTSPRSQPLAQRIAAEMGATYLALPHAHAAALSKIVRLNADARRSGVTQR
jgi:magnesium chelatase subunit D